LHKFQILNALAVTFFDKLKRALHQINYNLKQLLYLKSIMKAMMPRLVFTPRDLKANVDSEGWKHKTKIVCFAAAMAVISGTYQAYFNNLVYRSAIY